MPHKDPKKKREYKKSYNNIWREKNKEKTKEHQRKYDNGEKRKISREANKLKKKELEKYDTEEVKELKRIEKEKRNIKIKENYKKSLQRQREYDKTPLGKIKTWSKTLKRTYKLTLEDYAWMIYRQDRKGAICGGDGCKKGLCLDHRHSDGKVRGLLCDACNNGIARFDENTMTLRKAIMYLRKYK